MSKANFAVHFLPSSIFFGDMVIQKVPSLDSVCLVLVLALGTSHLFLELFIDVAISFIKLKVSKAEVNNNTSHLPLTCSIQDPICT